MGLIVKTCVAFCLGLSVLAAVQSVGLWSLKQYLQSDRALAGVPAMGMGPNFAASGIKEFTPLKFTPIDTTNGQRLAIEGAARRTDLADPRRAKRRAAASANSRIALVA